MTPITDDLVTDTRVDCDFDAAEETPTVPAVSATVVITIDAIFFFVDIYMSPVPYFVSTPSYRPVSNKALNAQKDIPFTCERHASFYPLLEDQLRVSTTDS